MLDTLIYPNHYAYSLRFDTNQEILNEIYPPIFPVVCRTIGKSKGNPPVKKRKFFDKNKITYQSIRFFRQIIDKYKIEHYLGTFEIADKSRKPHIQSIVWFKQKLTSNFMNKVRNYIKFHLKGEPNDAARSFAPVKKSVSSLTAYCAKNSSSGAGISTLTKAQYLLIPKWQAKTQLTSHRQLKLEEKLKTLPHTDFLIWSPLFSKAYYEVYENPCLHRIQYYKWAYKMKIISDECLVEYLGVNAPARRQNDRLNYKNNHSLTYLS